MCWGSPSLSRNLHCPALEYFVILINCHSIRSIFSQHVSAFVSRVFQLVTLAISIPLSPPPSPTLIHTLAQFMHRSLSLGHLLGQLVVIFNAVDMNSYKIRYINIVYKHTHTHLQLCSTNLCVCVTNILIAVAQKLATICRLCNKQNDNKPIIIVIIVIIVIIIKAQKILLYFLAVGNANVAR